MAAGGGCRPSGSVNRFVAQERVGPFTFASSRLFQGWIISCTGR